MPVMRTEGVGPSIARDGARAGGAQMVRSPLVDASTFHDAQSAEAKLIEILGRREESA